VFVYLPTLSLSVTTTTVMASSNLEDVPSVDLMSELLRRLKCSSKPDKRLILVGNSIHLSLSLFFLSIDDIMLFILVFIVQIRTYCLLLRNVDALFRVLYVTLPCCRLSMFC